MHISKGDAYVTEICRQSLIFILQTLEYFLLYKKDNSNLWYHYTTI